MLRGVPKPFTTRELRTDWLAKPTKWLASPNAGRGRVMPPKSTPTPETSQSARAQATFASQKVNSPGSTAQLTELCMKLILPRDGQRDFTSLQDRLVGKRENSEHYSPNYVFAWLVGRALDRSGTTNFLCAAIEDYGGVPPDLSPFFHSMWRGFIKDLQWTVWRIMPSLPISPTLNSLLDQPTQPPASFKMTAVIQPTTPMLRPLPATKEELLRIQKNVPKEWLTSLGDGTSATVEVALRHLRQSSVVHFACHGSQNLQHPLETGLQLTDGRLKVMPIYPTRPCILLQHMFAGFRRVVATMWTMADPDGPKIAEAFYEHLLKRCDANADVPILPDLTKAAEALQYCCCETVC
ncbi:hypothetical protein DFH09DRAFT_1081506 [Mycena vulgaris]|nr:hypothetical protein DFH09DRAFT_1081506 [Mycena vulgaris]